MMGSLRSQRFVTEVRILIVFWAPCFLFRSVISGNQKVNSTLIGLSRTVLQWDIIILKADYLFSPPAPYFVKMIKIMIMIFLVQAIDRCSASNSLVS